MSDVHLFRPCDCDALLDAIPKMIESAEEMRRRRMRPTFEDRVTISRVIFDFIKSYKRKVYGGQAVNAAIVDKLGSGHGIYPNETDLMLSDIEFYSPNPIEDVMRLCDILSTKGFSFVQGREAAHIGTYTISVMFVRICDVTFLPYRVYHFIPVMSLPSPIDPKVRVLFVHPRHILIDFLHILSDPFTSHWKVDRLIPRLIKMQSLFPMKATSGNARRTMRVQDHPEPQNDLINDIVAKVMYWAHHVQENLVMVGMLAIRAYDIDHAPIPEKMTELTFVSTNYDEDVRTLESILQDHVHVTQYYPVGPWLDERSTFVVGPFYLTLCGCRQKVMPFSFRTHEGFNVASASYVIANALAMQFAAGCDGNSDLKQHFEMVAQQMVKIRAMKLDGEGQTVTHETTTMRDVQLSYVGTPCSDMEVHMEMLDRSKNARPRWFSYDPRMPNRRKELRVMPSIKCDGSVIRDRPIPKSFSGYPI